MYAFVFECIKFELLHAWNENNPFASTLSYIFMVSFFSFIAISSHSFNLTTNDGFCCYYYFTECYRWYFFPVKVLFGWFKHTHTHTRKTISNCGFANTKYGMNMHMRAYTIHIPSNISRALESFWRLQILQHQHHQHHQCHTFVFFRC